MIYSVNYKFFNIDVMLLSSKEPPTLFLIEPDLHLSLNTTHAMVCAIIPRTARVLCTTFIVSWICIRHYSLFLYAYHLFYHVCTTQAIIPILSYTTSIHRHPQHQQQPSPPPSSVARANNTTTTTTTGSSCIKCWEKKRRPERMQMSGSYTTINHWDAIISGNI